MTETQTVDPTRSLEPAAPGPVSLFGTTDPEVILARTNELAAALARALKDRDLARRYGDNPRHFIHIEGWQLVGSFLGVSARVVWTRELEDGSGWEARAEAVAQDGRVLGAADAMAQRSEPGRQRQSQHALRAMAQVRARRGALRSVLAFVPAIGGLDFSDPDAPATRQQIVALHTLAGQRGWSRDERHRRAGVGSFNDLTREQAADLLDVWSAEDIPSESPGSRAAATAAHDAMHEASAFEHSPQTCPGHVWQPAPRRGFELCTRCGAGRREERPWPP